MRRFGILLLALALVAAACNRGDDADLTTTTAGDTQTTTTAAGSSTTEGDVDSETTTTMGTVEVPSYEIIAGDAGSGEYVVLVDPGAYTEADIRNIMEDVVDEFSPSTAHLIDLDEASDLVLREDLTDAERELLEAHYFARIVNGTTLEYLGPYGDLDSVYIGS